MGQKKLSFFVVGIYFIIALPVDGVKINEIYPAPAGGETEWIEIYNDSDATVDLNGFSLKDDANHTINLETTTLDPRGFILATSQNTLNNGGDTVYLKNSAGETVDTAAYTESLDSSTSWTRCTDGSGEWQKTNTITKKASNQSVCNNPTTLDSNTQQISATNAPTTDTPTQQVAQQTLTLVSNIALSEVMTYPSADGNEWIELFNGNATDVALDGWYIDDSADSGSAPKQFSLTIKANSYGVVDIASSMFNNSGDDVRLLDSSKNLKDSFSYTGGDQNATFGRISLPNGAICQQEPSYGVTNKPCIEKNQTTSTTKSSPTTTQSSTAKNTSPTAAKTSTKSTTVQTGVSQKRQQPLSFSNAENSATAPLPQSETDQNEGMILGASSENDDINTGPIGLARALAGSSAGIALINIIYIVNKLTHALKV